MNLKIENTWLKAMLVSEFRYHCWEINRGLNNKAAALILFDRALRHFSET